MSTILLDAAEDDPLNPKGLAAALNVLNRKCVQVFVDDVITKSITNARKPILALATVVIMKI